MKSSHSCATRVALLAASSLSALALAAPAAAQETLWSSDRANASEALREMVDSSMTVGTLGADPVLEYDVIANHTVTPGPGSTTSGANYANSPDVLSTGVNGVGQMISFIPSATGAGLALCTGTLINPRTVITAAHCVSSKPADQYGSVTGSGGGLTASNPLSGTFGTTNGIPISFGFSSTNRCRGVTVNGCASGTGPYENWSLGGFETNTGLNIYNGNQVWYAANNEFGLADIALVTLDTHASDIPTWTLLFSPLTGATHATVMGYGNSGVGLSGIGNAAGIDYRRRAAENMIDGLMSLADFIRAPAISGPDDHSWDSLAHSLYWYDFDDPDWSVENALSNPNFFNNTAPAGTRSNGYYDFNGLGDTALPNEGATASGDSGGPLVVDRTFLNPDGTFKPVVAGVLTGSLSFGGSNYYGYFSVYPPLFLYWQQIVANNPYKYASALAGDGDWFDPAHWVQDMDPNYAIIGPGGNLVNSLPGVILGQDSDAGRWSSDICFLEQSCSNVSGSAYPTSDGSSYIVIPGGPGSTNFVPNNVEPVNSADPALSVKARYYDVTLREAGTTTLRDTATIDMMTVDGAAKLNIHAIGTLNTWADFTQYSGWTNVDGELNTNEMLVVSGLLTGRGRINADFLTVVGGVVAPGSQGNVIGKLNVDGNMILASASAYLVDVSSSGADRLDVGGVLALNGGAALFSNIGTGPRDGQGFQIATADLVDGTFGSAGVASGVLVPHLTYGDTWVKVEFDAGSLAAYLSGGDATSLAFANALDQLRTNNYDKLWNLYGNIDWMNANQLAATFNAISPAGMIGETQLMQDRQSRRLFASISDRLSLLGTGQAKGISYSGGAASLFHNRDGMSARSQLGLTSAGQPTELPSVGRLTGFVMTGSEHVRTSYGGTRMADAGQHNRYFAAGMEAPMGAATVGTAFGYAESISNAGFDDAKSKVNQAAAYASLPIGGGAYVGGVVAAEHASTDVNRLGTDTVSSFRLTGATHSSRYMAVAEAGFRTGIGHGLSLNPRAQIGVSHYSLGGFREQGGETALALDDLKVNRIESRIGARLDGATRFGEWALRPNLQADYVRLLSGANNGLSVRFAAAPEYSFILPLTNGGSGWMEVKGGLELTREKVTIGLSGQATAGDAPISDQRGAVDLTLRF